MTIKNTEHFLCNYNWYFLPNAQFVSIVYENHLVYLKNHKARNLALEE